MVFVHHRDPISGSALVAGPGSHVRRRSSGARVVQKRFAVLLCSRSVEGGPLVLPGLVVQKYPDEDEEGADGAEEVDLVTEHEDAHPHRQGVFDGAGHAEGERRVCLTGY